MPRTRCLSSFVGVFPINDPRYLVLVSVDEPHGNKQSAGFATGGWIAAPGGQARPSSAWRRSSEFSRLTKIRLKFAVL